MPSSSPGSVLAGSLSEKGKLKNILISGIFLTSVSIGLYATMLQPFIISYIGNDNMIYFSIFGFALFLLYLSIMLVGIPMQTIIQNKTPENYMSRVFSIVSLITKGSAPIGALIYGLIIEKIQIHVSAIFIGVIIFIICAKYILKFKKMSELD